MKEVITKFFDSHENGLLLAPSATGSGKTCMMIELALSYAKNTDNKIIIVTPLIKNLKDVYKEFKEKYNDDEKFEKISILLCKNHEFLQYNFKKLVNSIPDCIKKTEAFKNIDAFLSIELPNEDKKKSLLIEKQFIKAEQEFRKEIQKYLSKENSSIKDKINFIKKPKNSWISELYPAVFSSEKQVFFMTASKFFYGNSTLVEPRYYFYSNKISDKALVFFDEFDDTKNYFAKHAFEETDIRIPDMISVFNELIGSTINKKFPKNLTKMTEATKQEISKNKDYKTPEEIIKWLNKKFEDVYKFFNLQFDIKFINEKEKNGFLFNDSFSLRPITNKEYLSFEVDKEQKIIKIKITPRKETKSGSINLFGDLIDCFRVFCFYVEILAINYQRLKKEENISCTYENATKTILDIFGLDETAINYFYNKIIAQTGVNFFRSNDEDISFYNEGFRCLEITNDDNYDLRSKVWMYDYYICPELILKLIAKRAKVVGLSATAMIDSVICNYDLEFLKKTLKENFCTIYDGKADYERIKNKQIQNNEGYDKVKIQVKRIEANDQINEKIKEIVDKHFKGDDFKLNRFSKLEKAITEFSLSKAKSMICFCNYNFSNEKGFEDILLEFQKISNIDVLNTLGGSDFKSSMEKAHAMLKNGKRVCVLTSYKTCGIGQNLQYEVDSVDDLIKIGNFESTEYKKDFEAIYVENPTYILPEPSDKTSKNLSIYYALSAREKHEISPKEFNTEINRVLTYKEDKKDDRDNKNIPSVLKNTKSYNNAVIARLLQAFGRTSRTKFKSEYFYVYYDENIRIDKDLIDRPELMIKEFQEFLKDVESGKSKITDTLGFENLLKCTKSQTIINRLMHFNQKEIESWEYLRDFIAKNPTIDEETYKELGELSENYCNIYMKAPKPVNCYHYTLENEKITKIQFSEFQM